MRDLYNRMTPILRPLADRVRAPLVGRLLARTARLNSAIDLPFDQDPLYKTYLHVGAHPLGILGGVSDVRPLLASDYINLSCRKTSTDFKETCIVPRCPIGHFVHSGHCEVLDRKERPAFAMRKSRQLIQWLIDKICEGGYVFLHVNKYYIPRSPFYLRQDVPHDCLITGYDGKKASFRIATFLDSGEYGVTDVSFSRMAMAMTLPGSETVLGDYICHFPAAIAIRPKHGMQLRFDPGAAHRNLRNYLYSSPPAGGIYARDDIEYVGDWNMLFGYPSESHSYGLEAFFCIVANIKAAVIESRRIDLRDTRVLWEHKQILGSNIEFWRGHGNEAISDEMRELYADVCKWAGALHFMCVAYNFRFPDSADELQVHLDEFGLILELEKEILSRTLSGLELRNAKL